MPTAQLDSLDEYERHLTATLDGWPPHRRTAFAAAMAERWLPTYAAFSKKEDWGDPESLRQTLNAVWAHVCGRTLGEGDRARHLGLVQESLPHMDDFDAPEALAAGVMVQAAVESCGAGSLGPAVQAGLSGFEAIVPDWSLDPSAQRRLWERGPVRKELAKQLTVLERLGAVATFDEATVEAFRRELRQRALTGEIPRRGAPAAPALRTNQDVFEQYRAIIESDIRGHRDWHPPPELDPAMVATMWVMEWAARYQRRFDLASGAYGKLADTVGHAALVRRQQAKDAVERTAPGWDADTRDMVDLVMSRQPQTIDVDSLDALHGYGPSVRRLWAEAKRAGKSDAEAWQHLRAWAHHRPAMWDAEDRRKKRGQAFSSVALGGHLAREVSWTGTGDPEHPWTAVVDGAQWRVRLNDFPDEIMYSLIVDGAVVGDFHDWPERWRR
jgi:uncharacterized protein YjaG (DUF416 family)